MFNRVFIRVVAGIVSVVSFVFGGHNAHAYVSVDDDFASYTDNKHALLAVESRGAADWACIPLVNGVNGDFKCTHDVSDTQTGVVVTSDKSSFYEYVNSNGSYDSCGPSVNNGNSTEYLGSWMCFCNATGLCAPTSYFSSSMSGATSNVYDANKFYTMAQWTAGIKAETGVSGGTGTGFWGGVPGQTYEMSGWGSLVSDLYYKKGVFNLGFPAEKIFVSWTGCVDGYWASDGMVKGVEFTVTSLMHNGGYMPDGSNIFPGVSSSMADRTLQGLMTYGQPSLSSNGVFQISGTSGWDCAYSCPGGGAATVPSISGATYSEKDDYTTGFACKANLYYVDDSGDFVLTGCNYGQ